MKTPLQRIRIGALTLAVVFVISVVGYRVLGGYSWLDAFWMVIITISTVGYSERSATSPPVQLLSIFVILFGMTAAAYTFGGLLQTLLEGELERTIGKHRMARELGQLKEHVIVCGYGRMGQNVIMELHQQDCPVVTVDSDAGAVERIQALGLLGFQGDATDEAVLQELGVERAQTLVTTLPSDADNVFITLTARNLNPALQIISRAEHQSTEKKLRQAGANKIAMPTLIGARQMVRMVTRPITADLMEMVSESTFTDFELDEIHVLEGSPLTNVTVGQTEAHRKHNLLVVAIKEPDGSLLFNPEADHQFQPHDTVILMGRQKDIKEFQNGLEGR